MGALGVEDVAVGAGCTLTRWYSNTNKLAFGFAPKVDLGCSGVTSKQ